MSFPKLHKYDELYTPSYALDYIEKYLDKNKIYWESCYGSGSLAMALMERGYNVVGNPEMNCLTNQPDTWDIMITNPPFSKNKIFIKRAIELGKPFLFLIRLEHLGGVEAYNLLSNIDFSIVIPKKRINYITPKTILGLKTGGAQFHSIWLLHGIKTEKQIIYSNGEK